MLRYCGKDPFNAIICLIDACCTKQHANSPNILNLTDLCKFHTNCIKGENLHHDHVYITINILCYKRKQSWTRGKKIRYTWSHKGPIIILQRAAGPHQRPFFYIERFY